MKNTILFLLLAALSYGQNNQPNPGTTPNYEFGFNLYSITDLKSALYRMTGEKYYIYDQNFFSGLFVKRHFNKNIIRASFDYTKKIINQETITLHSYTEDNGEVNRGELRLGYERELSSKIVVPFVCADLGYSYSEAKGKEIVYGDFVSYADRPYMIKTNWYFVNAGAGFKIKITKSVLLTYECGVQYGHYYSRDHSNPNIRETSAKFSSFNPVKSLGLSFRF
ncbi:MAG: hypothetical protein JNL60_03775 [Bacteroidia bacterium]|nr:hypothetical protein [Bacteroidia bacterium]